MKTKILTIFLLTPLLIWQLCMAAFAADLQPLKYPNVSVAAIKDKAMDRQYELYIKLPENYEANPKQQYPVIYFTDGLWNLGDYQLPQITYYKTLFWSVFHGKSILIAD